MIKKLGLGLLMTAVIFNGFASSARAEENIKAEEIKIHGKPLPDTIASVNGTALSSQNLKSELAAYKMFMEAQGREFSPADQEKMTKELVARAIDSELILQKSKQIKIQVLAESVQKEFDNIRKQFPSEEAFQAALTFQHHTPATLKSKIEKQLLEDEFIRKEIAPKVKVDDSKAEAYYNENKKVFMKPEMFEVNHIFASAIDTSKEGKAETPEAQEKAKRLMSIVDQEAREKINTVLQKLKKGENFAELAKKYSDDDVSKNNGGSLGTLPKENILPEIADAMVKLKVGDTSDVVKSPYGYHIIKLTAKTPAQMAPFAEVKSDILNFLMKKEIGGKKKTYIDQLKKTANIKTFL
jgi:parvulin-like peptidyl-prolyl isomerase